ncbi:hypothetical protein TRIUR3_32172 [Triticum urartu]|uniref:Uncharacterized protein n=1 Tax=Triticum urartu TaxID=4572 RepID=M7Z3Y8_TRIUA|nr:hypothetical protein TRIUR3_32172 [Triticum urartu]
MASSHPKVLWDGHRADMRCVYLMDANRRKNASRWDSEPTDFWGQGQPSGAAQIAHLGDEREAYLRRRHNSTTPGIDLHLPYAPLEQLDGFMTVGLYPHPPTGEYRLLLYHETDQRAIYAFSIGSNQPPRRIGRPDPLAGDGLLFRGSLHWHTGNRIMVFDTATESFRQIRAPVAQEDYGRLFEMDDMLGIFFLNDEKTTVDILVMQDYQGEVWAFKCRVELPVAEIRDRCQNSSHIEEVMVVNGDGELLVLVGFEDWLFQVDIDGKLIASFHARGLPSYNIVHKQTLVQHTFFPTLEGYVMNDSPFI